jgi:Arylsulfotransferase (ASST)
LPRQRTSLTVLARTTQRTALAATIAAAACSAVLAASPAASAAPPAVVVSPLAGTLDAAPTTQISFLGVPASDLSNIVVVGSRSGRHAGRLVSYSTNTGGSFVPSKPFTPNESVTVTATVVGYGAPVPLQTDFTVSSPYTLPAPPSHAPARVTSTNVMRFHSRHDLEPPAVTVTTAASAAGLGDIFISPDSGPGQAGPMIVTPTGKLVWFDPLPHGTTAFDLNLQSYEGAPVLTWWQGEVVEGHGQGEGVIESTHYTPVATVHAGNGLYADLHDFEITPQGTAWITAFAPEHWNLKPEGGRTDGLIDDCAIQEIDIKTGLVMFQWNALGHVALSESYSHAPSARGSVYDFFHVNSIDALADGDILISARNTWTAYLISGTTGQIAWRLGGKMSSFTIGQGAAFAWQHDVELLPDGTVSVFDNEDTPPEASESKALDISLDAASHSATLVDERAYPGRGILAPSQGDVQLLANGDDFVGWGQTGEVSEFSPAGELTFDMHLAWPANTYRAFRYAWDAEPLTQPALVAASGRSRTELYASWNGATDVAAWRVLAGRSANKLTAVGTFAATGFETAISAPTTAPYIEVQALSATGTPLRASKAVKPRGAR